MDIGGVDMDWIKIVEFHKEIVLRAQDQFYRLKEADYRRYSILEDFKFDDFSGPWIVNQSQISNDYFIRNSSHLTEQTGWVLGLHAFKYYNDWCPIFVKEISVEVDEELNWNFQPIQANWDVSPQFVKIIGNISNLDLNDLNENINRMLERVYNRFKYDETSKLLDLLLEELTLEYPDVKESIGNTLIDVVLFNTPDQAGKYDKNLMKDYEVLLERLKREPSDIGGLALIESFGTEYSYNEELTVESIIPLNTSQENAVRGILLKNPITVISGPPGCGKSQVVVSALYNSWSENRSVLFASQNNKAVEVVKERIESIDIPIPMLARAGSRQFSNVANLPRLMTNAITQLNRVTKDHSIKSIDKKIISLKDKRKQLQNYINSKVPVKLEETYRAALSSYYESIKASNEINDQKAKFDDLISGFELNCTIEDLLDIVIYPLSRWLDLAETYLSEYEENVDTISVLKSEVALKEQSYLKSVESIDELSGVSCADIDVEAYEKTRITYENFKRDWQEEYARYVIFEHKDDELINRYSKDQLTDLLSKFEDVKNLVRKIITVFGSSFDDYINFKAEYNQHVLKLTEMKIDTSIDIDLLLMNEWMMIYIEYGDQLDGFVLPLTQKYKAKKRAMVIEQDIKRKLPQRALIEIGGLSQNRSALADVLMCVQDYYEFRTNNRQHFNAMNELDSSLSDIKIKSQMVEFETEEAYFTSLHGLLELVKTLEISCEEYRRSLGYYALKERQNDSVTFLSKYVERFKVLAEGDRIVDIMINSKLSAFVTMLDALRRVQIEEKLNSLNYELENTKIDNVFEKWKEIASISESIKSKYKQIESVETFDVLLSRWVSERPPILANYNEISSFDTTKLVERHILLQLEDIYSQYKEFREIKLPELNLKADEEYNFAVGKMNEIIMNFSSEVINDELLNIIDTISNMKPGYEWPTKRIEELIKNKDVSKIQASIERYDRQIQEMVKDKGCIVWKKRIREYDSALNRFDRLISSFGKSTLDEVDFTNVLKLMPVWITTAQSTRGIPMSPSLFDTLIIDEASQCTLTNLLPLIYRAKSIVAIGDSEQLPAIPNIGESTEVALGDKFSLSEDELYNYGHVNNDVFRTILNFLPGGYSNVFNLIEHYRSIPQIIVFSNRYIYNQRLALRRNVSDEVFATDSLIYGVHKFHIVGAVNKGKNNRSWINRNEANKVIEVIDNLLSKYNVSNKRIGIVTPFAAQVDLIESMMSRNEKYSDIIVGTAHKFQGDEREIMILSTVLAPNMKQSTIDWIQTPHNLINVAVTRARNSLIVIGDFITMKKQVGVLKDLSEYIDDIELTKRSSVAEYKLLTYLGMQGIKPAVHCMVKDIEVDFVINRDGIRLAIEIDGKQHEKQKVMDSSRDALLLSLGYKVMRISARDVLETPNVVVDKIMDVFKEDF